MEWIQPMEPVLRTDIIKGTEWIHEIKWDGIRGMTYVGDSSLRIFTKRGNERTQFYPELHEILELTSSRKVILDGEIVTFDEDANPYFYSSLVRERVRDIKKIKYYKEKYPARYILFDILQIDGRDLTGTPLYERKDILKGTVSKSGTITLTDSFTDGEGLYGLMKSKSWEGIVSKKLDSRYLPGKAHNDWFKTKLSRKMLSVIGGVQWKAGMPNSLLLGIFRNTSLVFVGKASIGLNQEQIHILKEYAQRLEQKDPPFKRESLAGISGDFTWFTPALVCWVHFMEYTNDGHLRHPKILGFTSARPDEANGKEYVE